MLQDLDQLPELVRLDELGLFEDVRKPVAIYLSHHLLFDLMHRLHHPL